MSVTYGDYAGLPRFELDPDDSLWPPQLNDLPRPPQRLYGYGDPATLALPSISIIGARRATPYGTEVAALAARVAVEAGVSVVSGGAIGCDQAAGRAASAAGGTHVAVLGTGADVVYPAGARDLLLRLAKGDGAVVSIAPWGAGPRRFAFPARNRVIAALSRALFISEAGMPSGTLSTAEAAVEIGRELLCAPGSILSPLSRGTNHLIAEGATCIVDEPSLEVAVSRIFGTLRFTHGPAPGTGPLSGAERRVLSAVTASPARVEALARMLDVGVVRALEVLGGLEGEGLVCRLPDGSYTASQHALRLMTSFGA